MSASRTSLPTCVPFHEQFASPNDNLQIRVVPYNPSRLDDSTSPRTASFISNLSHREPSNNVTVDGQNGLPKSYGSLGAAVTAPRPAVTSKAKGKEAWGGANRFVTPMGIKPQPAIRQLSLSSAPSISSSPSPWRRTKRAINVHSDGTFSLVQQPESPFSRTDSSITPSTSFTIPSGSQGRMSSITATTLLDDHACVPLAPVEEKPQEVSAPSSPVQSPNSDIESPRNYRLSSGGRRVFSEGSDYHSEDGTDSSQPAHRRMSEGFTADDDPIQRAPPFPLGAKASFQSFISCSAVSERTNYRVYVRSSPRSSSATDFAGLEIGSLPPSSSNSNYVGFPENASAAHLEGRIIPQSDSSEANYVLHSHSRSSSAVSGSTAQFRTAFSQESLIVAPLRPVKQPGFGQATHGKSYSYDSSITTSSIAASSQSDSLRSLANFVAREAPHAIDADFGVLPDDSHDDWQASPHDGSAVSSNNQGRKKHWSTALSTVMSEVGDGSEPGSRSRTPLFNVSRGPSPLSHHSRKCGSFSSSLAGLDENLEYVSHSRTSSLDRPPAVYNRELVQTRRLIRDHDEHGDGLAELEDVHRRLSRVRRHNSNSSSNRSSYSSRSSRSSRCSRISARSSRANSLNRGSLPQWARLYYGGEERQIPTAKPSLESMASSFSDGQPRNSLLSRSPSLEAYATDINNPRRREREYPPRGGEVISEFSLPQPLMEVALSIKRRTSSIWSPHLRRDRRAGQYSMWTPPSLIDCEEDSGSWKRQAQIVIFVTGFILPFIWIIGAILPLPAGPDPDMAEHDRGAEPVDLKSESQNQLQNFHAMRLRDRTKWWRGVNRRMAMLGALLIGAYIALTVVGVHQQWATA